MFPDLVNGADIGMVQRRGGPRFVAEPFQCLGIPGNILRQKLKCYEAAKLDIFGFVYNPHSAHTQLLNDAIVRNGLSDHEECTEIVRRDAMLGNATGGSQRGSGVVRGDVTVGWVARH